MQRAAQESAQKTSNPGPNASGSGLALSLRVAGFEDNDEDSGSTESSEVLPDVAFC
jgi:hypothetical protein